MAHAAGVVRAAPALDARDVLKADPQAVWVVGGRALVAADQVATIPAHLSHRAGGFSCALHGKHTTTQQNLNPIGVLYSAMACTILSK